MQKYTFPLAKLICESSLKLFNISATFQKMFQKKFAHATAMQLFVEAALPLCVEHRSCTPTKDFCYFLGGGVVKIRSYFFEYPNLNGDNCSGLKNILGFHSGMQSILD